MATPARAPSLPSARARPRTPSDPHTLANARAHWHAKAKAALCVDGSASSIPALRAPTAPYSSRTLAPLRTHARTSAHSFAPSRSFFHGSQPFMPREVPWHDWSLIAIDYHRLCVAVHRDHIGCAAFALGDLLLRADRIRLAARRAAAARAARCVRTYTYTHTYTHRSGRSRRWRLCRVCE